MRTALITIILSLSILWSYSQDKAYIDSLVHQLEYTTSDTAKVNLLNKIAEHQKEHMLKAFDTAGDEAVRGFWKVLSSLLKDENRTEILNQINKDLSINK